MEKASKDTHATPPSIYDFSEFMVPGATLPVSDSEFNELSSRLHLALSYDFALRERDAGRDLTVDADRDVKLDSWDEYIFESIQDYGPFILLSHTVVQRIFAWQFDLGCIKKLSRLGTELYKAARIRHGLAKGRITPKHAKAKEHLVEEVSRLREMLINAWPRGAKEVVEFIDAVLRQPDSPYPNLTANIRSLLDFLGKQPDVAIRFRGSVKPASGRQLGRADDVGPSQLVCLWIAQSENRSPESVRQELSRQSKKVRPTVL